MSESHVCSECGGELSDLSSSSICAKCLLKAGLDTSKNNATDSCDAKTELGSEELGSEFQTLDSSGVPTDASASLTTRIRYFGDYELLEEIARGGMGVVYKARQVSLNRIVAVKMILSGQLASEDDIKRFRSEAEAAAQLDHPGIVPIYEVGEFEGQHFFSMGYVDGPCLADRIQDGPLPPRTAAEFVKKIAISVFYAHNQGVIHRDLKPANVLLDVNDEPKVTDFGLAKRVESDSHLTVTGQVLGTPSYMPPEQCVGKSNEITQSADIYALGAVLYALLTARPPFQAATPTETLMQVLDQTPVTLRQLNRKIPRDLETITLKCLEKEREHRYSSANELADDLQRFLEDEPIRARPVGPLQRALRFTWKHRRAAALFLVCAMIVFILTIGALAINRSRQSRLAMACASKFFDAVQSGDEERITFLLTNRARTSESRNTLLQAVADHGIEYSVKLNEAKVSGKKANVTYVTDGHSGLVGTVHLIREDGRWRIDHYGEMESMLHGLSLGLAQVQSEIQKSKSELKNFVGKVYSPAASTETTDEGGDSVDNEVPVGRLPNATLEKPSWADADAPFDMDAFFSVPEQNAAPLYYDALLEFYHDLGNCFTGKQYEIRAAAAQVRWRWLIYFYQRFKNDPSSISNNEFDRFLREYETGLAKLKTAQSMTGCVFEPDIDTLALNPHMDAAESAAKVLAMKTHRSLKDNDIDSAIDDIELVLRLCRDLRPRGSSFCQYRILKIEEASLESMIEPVLDHQGLTSAQCGRLIQILIDHDEQQMDPFLEAAKHDYLMLRQVFHWLEHGEYSSYRAKQLEIDSPMPVAKILVTDFSELGGLRINSHLLRASSRELFRENEKATKLLKDLESNQDTSQLDRMLAGMFLTEQLLKMGPADYKSEVVVLNQRFRQIDELPTIPFPQRIDRTLTLRRQWTIHDEWQDTKILRLFIPYSVGMGGYPWHVMTRHRLTICFAAIKLQKLDEKPIFELQDIVRQVGISDVPIDPYSGKSIRFAREAQRVIVYSFGPDRDDDHGKRKAPWTRPKQLPDGDFVFHLGI